MTQTSDHTHAPQRKVLALTMGDAAGIGPEILLKSLQEALPDGVRGILYGARQVFERADHRLSNQGGSYHSLSKKFLDFDDTQDINWEVIDPRQIPIVEVSTGVAGVADIRPGEPSAAAAHLQLRALEHAIEDAKSGLVDAIVTAPWTKELFRLTKSPAVGHTEVLARAFNAPEHVMMLAGPRLRVALATVHVPIREVHEALTEERLAQTIHTTVQDLTRWFGIRRPHIAVCGLNPHAGEHGVMGLEEDEMIRPLVERLQKSLYDSARIEGPLPPDTLFSRYHGGKTPFDAVICMYHDQGLIPLKLLHFGESANLTLGLPVLRTSVDHGTAYDIAGRGIADERSMRYAMELALELLHNRDAQEQPS